MKIFDHVYLVGSGKCGFDMTNPSDCNVYLLDGGNELALIDAGTGLSASRIIENIEANGFSPKKVKYIMLTHFHADHAGGAAKLRKLTGAKVIAHGSGKKILETADENAIDLIKARISGYYPLDYIFEPCKLDLKLKDKSTFNVGTLDFKTRLLPGHSLFDTYYFAKNKYKHMSLFSGDGIFYDGKISLQNTHDFNLQALANSVAQLNREKIDSLFPGHLQPALQNGNWHVEKAHKIFEKLGVPPSII